MYLRLVCAITKPKIILCNHETIFAPLVCAITKAKIVVSLNHCFPKSLCAIIKPYLQLVCAITKDFRRCAVISHPPRIFNLESNSLCAVSMLACRCEGCSRKRHRIHTSPCPLEVGDEVAFLTSRQRHLQQIRSRAGSRQKTES